MADFTVDDLVRGMTAEVAQGETVKKSDVAEELQAILDKFADNFGDRLESASKLIKSVSDDYKERRDAKDAKREPKTRSPKLKDVGMGMSMREMVRGFQTALGGDLGSVSSPLNNLGSLMGQVRKLLDVTVKQNNRFVFGSAQHVVIDNIDDLINAGMGGGADVGSQGGGGWNWGGGRLGRGFMSGMRRIAEIGGTAIAFQSIFEGALVEEYKFIRGMREIAYQTDALDSSMFNIQGRLREIGKQVKYTGVIRHKFLAAYMKNLKKGIKSQQQSLKVTQLGLFTAKQLGMNVDATASRFHDWHMQLRLNTGELQVLSGATGEIAKMTGVTGENLEQAVQASDKFMKNLRNSANLSTTAAKNMIAMTAAAQKYGVEEQVSSIQQALSSLSDFRRADAGFRAFLMRAGELAGVAHEVFTTEVMHDPRLGQRFVGGLKKHMEHIVSLAPKEIRKALSGNILEADLQDIPFEIRQYLNEVTQQITGGTFKGLGDMQMAIKATEEGFMSFEQRMKQLETERDQNFRTTQEYMQYQQKIASTTLQKTGQLLNEYSTAITKAEKLDLAGAPLEEMFAGSGARFQQEMERSTGAFAKLGLAGASHEEKINGLYKTRFDLVAKMGNEFDVDIKSTSKMMQKALQGPEDKRDSLIREAMSTLNEDLQKIETARERKLDPVKSIQYRIMEANELVASNTGKIMNYMFTLLGAGGIAIAGLGVMTGTFKSIFGELSGGLINIGKGLHLLSAGGVGVKGGLGMVGGALGGGAATGLLAIGAVAGAIGGIVHAFHAAEHATDIFNTSLDELTLNQKWAAEGAGFMTGVLNTLTFGLFKGALGPTGWLTQKLALLFDAFPPLAWALQTVMIPVKILWGILKGIGRFIKNVFIGLWDGIKEIFKPFQEFGEMLGDIFKDFQKAFGGFGMKAKDAIGIVETLASVIGGVGKAIGWVLKQIGWVVGWIIRVVLVPIRLIVGALAGLVKGVLKVVLPVVKALMKFFSGIGKILKGIFTLDGTMFTDGLRTALYGAGQFIWEMLVGVFLRLPGVIFETIGGAFRALPKAIQKVGSFLWTTITEALIGIGDWLWSVITRPWKETKEAIVNSEMVKNFQAGAAGMEGESWGMARGAGRWGGGLADVVTGSEEGGLYGHTVGRVVGAGKMIGGAAEGIAGFGSALVGRGWLWEDGGKVPGSGAVPAVVHGGELIIPADYTAKGVAGVLQFLKDRYGSSLPHFAEGGVVGVAPEIAAMNFAQMAEPARDYKTAAEGGMPFSPALMNFVAAKQIPMFNQAMTSVTMKGKQHLSALGDVAAGVFRNKDISRMTDYARVGMAAAKDHAFRFLQYTKQIEFGNVGKFMTGLTDEAAKWGKQTASIFAKMVNYGRKAFTAIYTASRATNLIKYGKRMLEFSKRIPVLGRAVALTERGAKAIAGSRFGKTVKDVSQALGITKAPVVPFSAAKMPPATRAGKFAAAAKSNVIAKAGMAKEWIKGLKAAEVVKQVTPPYVAQAIKAIGEAPGKMATAIEKATKAAEGAKKAAQVEQMRKAGMLVGGGAKPVVESGKIAKALTTAKGVAKGISPPVVTKMMTPAAAKIADGAKALDRGIKALKVAPVSALSKAAGTVGKGAGKVLKIPGLSHMLGALSGFLERDAATGVFKGEGIAGAVESSILGALTGGADTGSMFSRFFGIKKGGAGDEAMGIMGAAGTGAMAGAALGSVVPVIGTGMGAIAGAVSGGVAELYKIMTDAGSPLRKFLMSWAPGIDAIIKPLKYLAEGIKATFSGAWQVIKGLFTLDFKSMGDGLVTMLLAVPKMLYKSVVAIVPAIGKQIIALPKYFAAVILKLPQLLYQAVAGIFTSIGGMADKVTGPIGAILKTILTPFKLIGEIAGGIGGVLGGLFSTVVGLFSFDFETIKEGFGRAIIALPNMVGNVIGMIGKSLIAVVGNVPQFFLNMFGKIFVDLPKYLMNAISSGLESLSKGIFAPIFQPMLDGWNSIKGVIMGIIEPFEATFAMLKGVFSDIKNTLMTVFQPFFGPLLDVKSGLASVSGFFGMLGTALGGIVGAIGWVAKQIGWLIGTVLKPLGTVVGWVASAALVPLQVGIQGLGLAAKFLINTIGVVVKVIVTLLKPAIMGIGKIIGGVVNSIAGFVHILTGILTFDWDKIKEGFKRIWDGFVSLVGGIFTSLGGTIKAVFWEIPKILGGYFLNGLQAVFVDFPIWLGSSLLSGLKATLIDFPIWLGSSLLSGLKATLIDFPIWLGQSLLGGMKSVFLDFPVWLFTSVTQGLANLGTWLWDHTIGALIDAIPAWVKNLFGGAAADASKGYGETAGEQMNTMLTEGPGVMHGLGGMAGGVGDMLKGDLLQGAGKIAGGALETGVGAVTGTAKAAWGGVKAVGSALNPFNWFKEGSREITKTGLGVLHEGEAVIPNEALKGIKAEGDGPFRGVLDGVTGFIGKSFKNITNMAMNPLETVKKVGGFLGGAFDKIKGAAINFATNPMDTIKGLGETAKGFVSKSYETLKTVGGRLIDDPLGVMGGLTEAGGKLLSGDFTGAAATATTALMGEAAPVATTALPEVHDEIKKEQAGGEPTTTKVAGEELSEMVTHLKKNVDLLTAMNAHLIEMVSIMGEGSEIIPYEDNSMGDASPGSSKPIAPAKYPALNVGLAAASPGRQGRFGQSTRPY